MNAKQFRSEVNLQLNICRGILNHRAALYAPGEDRLENFKKAAALQDVEPETALFGMLSKHLVALSEVVTQFENDVPIADDVWTELITDIINYMLLLRGLLTDRTDEEFEPESGAEDEERCLI